MGNQIADPRNQLIQPTGLAMGSLGQGPGYGSPVNPDGSFRRSDGSVDWAVGTGPGYNWGGENQRTGQPPIGSAPEPDSVAPRGTPEWRNAYAQRQQWIASNRAQGRTLADLGMEPTRGGGLSDYMKYSNTPRGSAGGGAPNPGAAQMQPGGNMVDQAKQGTPQSGLRNNPFGSLNFPIMGSPVIGGLSGVGFNQPQNAQKRQKPMFRPMASVGQMANNTQSQLGAVPIYNGRV